MSFLPAAKALARVNFTGVGPMIDTLRALEGTFASADELRPILRRAAVPIANQYRTNALAHDATGNLAASVRVKTKKYPSGNVVAVAGPEHTGSAGATADRPSGNHSWLVEFGSHGRRRPKNRGKRKTYIMVHKRTPAGKYKKHGRTDADSFAKMGAGYYFLMSSWRNPTRAARAGKGYTHDFLPGGGAYTLSAGGTYGAMPALHLMERTLAVTRPTAEAIIRDGLVSAINRRLEARLK